jgi:hypothetical protein
VLTAIAAEHNISTTAFLVERERSRSVISPPPANSASLAAAYVVLRMLRRYADEVVLRRLAPGIQSGGRGLLAIQLPATIARPCRASVGLTVTLNAPFIEERETPAQYFVIRRTRERLNRTDHLALPGRRRASLSAGRGPDAPRRSLRPYMESVAHT